MEILVLFAAMAFIVLVIAIPIILILRITSWYKKLRQKEEGRVKKVIADYAQAGFHGGLNRSMQHPHLLEAGG